MSIPPTDQPNFLPTDPESVSNSAADQPNDVTTSEVAFDDFNPAVDSTEPSVDLVEVSVDPAGVSDGDAEEPILGGTELTSSNQASEADEVDVDEGDEGDFSGNCGAGKGLMSGGKGLTAGDNGSAENDNGASFASVPTSERSEQNSPEPYSERSEQSSPGRVASERSEALSSPGSLSLNSHCEPVPQLDIPPPLQSIANLSDPNTRPLEVAFPLSPRKSKRMRVQTPRAAESPMFGAVSPRSGALATPEVYESDYKAEILLSVAQAIQKNAKLPKGFKYVPVDGSTLFSLNGKRKRKRPTRPEDELGPTTTSSIPSQTPLLALSYPVLASPAANNTAGLNRKSNRVRTLAVETKSASKSKPHTELTKEEYLEMEAANARERREKTLALLQRRLSLLRAREAVLHATGGTSIAAPLPMARSNSTSKTPKAPPKPKTPRATPQRQDTPALHVYIPSPYTPSTASPAIHSFHPSPSPGPLSFNEALTPGGNNRQSNRTIKKPKFLVSDDNPVKLTDAMRRCRDLLTTMMSQKFSHIFNAPVDAVALNIPNYFNVIKQPMDLGTVKDKLTAGEYADGEMFGEDVRLVWKNAIKFNPKTTFVHQTAVEYSKLFEKKFEKIPKTNAPRPTKPKRKRTTDGEAKKTPRPGSSDPTLTPAVVQHMEAMQKKLEAMQKQMQSMSKTGQQKLKQDKTPLTRREKEVLKTDIFKLPPSKLGPVVEMCSRNQPAGGTGGDDDEIEIDIDSLDIPTLRELQRYVKRALQPIRRRKTGDNGKTPTPGRSPYPDSPEAGSEPSQSMAGSSPSPSTRNPSPPKYGHYTSPAAPSPPRRLGTPTLSSTVDGSDEPPPPPREESSSESDSGSSGSDSD